MTSLDKLFQEVRRLSPAEQLRLIKVLCEELRAHLPTRVIALEGRWESLPFDEVGMDEALEELHRRSWQHLEEELRE